MDAVDDIALGEFSTADLSDLVSRDSVDVRNQQEEKTHLGMRLSFAFSAGIHLLLASTVYYFLGNDIATQEGIFPTSLHVNFVPSNPQQPQADQSISESVSEILSEPVEVISSRGLGEVMPSSPAPQQMRIESAEVEIQNTIEAEIAEVDTAVRLGIETQAINIPSVDSVRSAIVIVERGDNSQFYVSDCNKIEEEKEFRSCAPAVARAYSALTKNPVYEFHNPEIEISRSRQSVTTLERHSDIVADALTLSNLPAGLSVYVLEEVEQGIETYSNNSNRVVGHMNSMVDKIYAGEQARRLFDHWVVQRSAILKSRRIGNWSDALFEKKCKSYEKFILAPAEFARCLSLGVSPLELIIGR